MDRHLTYVAMTRHRDGVQLYAAQDEFTNAGRLVEHGAAPFEHDPQKSGSYFVTLENDKGEQRTLWGVDLERAMKEAAPEIGEKIGLQHEGSTPVTLPDGTQTHRNTWEVQDAGELAYSQLERRLSRSGVKETTLDYNGALGALDARCFGCLPWLRQECAMPVEMATTAAGPLRFFVVCDRREDTAHVPVPRVQLEQWQCSPRLLADGVAKLVGLRRSLSDDDPRRLDLGVLKGTQASAHVVLHVESALSLHLAGHVLSLPDVLVWTDKGMTVERRALVRCVDNAVAGAGAKESAEKRRDRLGARRKELIASGVHNFNEVLAQEEGLTTTRIKQILNAKPKEPLQDAKDSVSLLGQRQRASPGEKKSQR